MRREPKTEHKKPQRAVSLKSRVGASVAWRPSIQWITLHRKWWLLEAVSGRIFCLVSSLLGNTHDVFVYNPDVS